MKREGILLMRLLFSDLCGGQVLFMLHRMGFGPQCILVMESKQQLLAISPTNQKIFRTNLRTLLSTMSRCPKKLPFQKQSRARVAKKAPRMIDLMKE